MYACFKFGFLLLIVFSIVNVLSFRPSIRFSSDEAIACRLATNEIQFFDARDFSKGVVHRIRVPGLAAIELSKTPGSHVAAFVPESKVCGSQAQADFGDFLRDNLES